MHNFHYPQSRSCSISSMASDQWRPFKCFQHVFSVSSACAACLQHVFRNRHECDICIYQWYLWSSVGSPWITMTWHQKSESFTGPKLGVGGLHRWTIKPHRAKTHVHTFQRKHIRWGQHCRSCQQHVLADTSTLRSRWSRMIKINQVKIDQIIKLESLQNIAKLSGIDPKIGDLCRRLMFSPFTCRDSSFIKASAVSSASVTVCASEWQMS